MYPGNYRLTATIVILLIAVILRGTQSAPICATRTQMRKQLLARSSHNHNYTNRLTTSADIGLIDYTESLIRANPSSYPSLWLDAACGGRNEPMETETPRAAIKTTCTAYSDVRSQADLTRYFNPKKRRFWIRQDIETKVMRSVEPTVHLYSARTTGHMKSGTIIGIVLGCVGGLGVIAILIWLFVRWTRWRKSEDLDNEGLDEQVARARNEKRWINSGLRQTSLLV